VLIVEDEERIAEFLAKGIEAAGYAAGSVSTGAEALAAVGGDRPDLVVLDLGLPDMDGSDVLVRLRDVDPPCPTIVLTARGELPDRLRALDLGADDYLPKPFAFDELLARMRAVLRRSTDGSVIERCGVRLDTRAQMVSIDGRTRTLSPREVRLLEVFLRNPGKVLSRRELLSKVWRLDFDPGSNLVDVYVGALRRKLGDGCIQTVRGAGYRFAGISSHVPRTVGGAPPRRGPS
jgi:DNA-binding response OmpR family regulator